MRTFLSRAISFLLIFGLLTNTFGTPAHATPEVQIASPTKFSEETLSTPSLLSPILRKAIALQGLRLTISALLVNTFGRQFVERPHGAAMRWSGQDLSALQHQVVNEAIASYFDPQLATRTSPLPMGGDDYKQLDPQGILAEQQIRIYSLPGLNDRIRKIALQKATELDLPYSDLLVSDLVVHPGLTRGNLYIDSTMIDDISRRCETWRTKLAFHELTHIHNAGWSEEQVQKAAPLPTSKDDLPSTPEISPEVVEPVIPFTPADSIARILHGSGDVRPKQTLDRYIKVGQEILKNGEPFTKKTLSEHLNVSPAAVKLWLRRSNIKWTDLHLFITNLRDSVTIESVLPDGHDSADATINARADLHEPPEDVARLLGTSGAVKKEAKEALIAYIKASYEIVREGRYLTGTAASRQRGLSAGALSMFFSLQHLNWPEFKDWIIRTAPMLPTEAPVVIRTETPKKEVVSGVAPTERTIEEKSLVLEVPPGIAKILDGPRGKKKSSLLRYAGAIRVLASESPSFTLQNASEKAERGPTALGQFLRREGISWDELKTWSMTAVLITPGRSQKAVAPRAPPAVLWVPRKVTGKQLTQILLERNLTAMMLSQKSTIDYPIVEGILEKGTVLTELMAKRFAMGFGISLEEFAALLDGRTLETLHAEPSAPLTAVAPAVWPWDEAGLDWVGRVIVLLQGLADPNTAIAERAREIIHEQLLANAQWTEPVRNEIERYLIQEIGQTKIVSKVTGKVPDIGDLERSLKKIGEFSNGQIQADDNLALDLVDALSKGWEQTADTASDQQILEPPTRHMPTPVTLTMRAQIKMDEERVARSIYKRALHNYENGDGDLVTAYSYLLLTQDKIQQLLAKGSDDRLLQFQNEVRGKIEEIWDLLEPQIRKQLNTILTSYSQTDLTSKVNDGSLGVEAVEQLKGFEKLMPHANFKDWVSNEALKMALTRIQDFESHHSGPSEKLKTGETSLAAYQIFLINNSWLDPHILFNNGDRSRLNQDVSEEFERFFTALAIGGDAMRTFTQSAPLEKFYVLRIRKHPERRIFFRIFNNGTGPAIVILAADQKSKLEGKGPLGYHFKFVNQMIPFNNLDPLDLKQRALRVEGLSVSPGNNQPLGIHIWLWQRIDRLRFFFGRPSLSDEDKAHHAYWVEQIPYTLVTILTLLPWGAAHLTALGAFALLTILFGTGHTELYQWQNGHVISLGRASWQQRLAFMRTGALWQAGLLATAVASLWQMDPFALVILSAIGHVVAMASHLLNNIDQNRLISMASRTRRKQQKMSPIISFDKNSNYPTFIASDDVYDVLTLGHSTLGGLIIPSIGETPDIRLVHDIIDLAAQHQLAGAGELKKALTHSDVILLRASQLVSPLVVENTEPLGKPGHYLIESPEGAVLNLIWRQRMMIELQHLKQLEPAFWARVSETISTSKDPDTKNLINLSTEVYEKLGLGPAVDSYLMFALTYAISLFADDNEGKAALNKLVGRNLASILEPLRAGTKPTLDEATGSRRLAVSLIAHGSNSDDESSWLNILEIAREKLSRTDHRNAPESENLSSLHGAA